ncbi:MAG: hypothetical protein Q7U82_10995 [Gammaproteobacteria bacterium]|nr:hypothetical protein [Gammaproteobacteria bacterium]
MNKNETKREVPTNERVEWRGIFLQNLRDNPERSETPLTPYLESGNKKVGFKSKAYSSVFVWNMPTVRTCPGASKWCLTHCYNADERKEVYAHDKWEVNLLCFERNRSELEQFLINELNKPIGRCAVRVHSSGDFFSNDYIRFWRRISEKCPKASFWAYTRSWAVGELLDDLEILKSQHNFQLFASWDKTMPDPPNGWRVSFVYSQDTDSALMPGLLCPEERTHTNCAKCRYCIEHGDGNVLFREH